LPEDRNPRFRASVKPGLPQIKEKALALVTPADVKPGRYKPADATLAFLESL
jgi:hypothetical protein